MLSLKQIESFYPESLQVFKRSLLREYLQYKILEAIFDSELGGKLSFMGGTAIHIVYQSKKFSEDLDFDNLGLKEEDFDQLTRSIQRRLSLEGYRLETRNVFRGAYRSYIRIADILFENGLSAHKEEKLLIQIDAESQEFRYQPEKFILNKFDVFLRIKVVPLDILLAQKIYAIFKRKRAMGRDFYDVAFLIGKTKPNYDYLRLKLGIIDTDLKSEFLLKCSGLDFNQLARDVEPFLPIPNESKRVLFFYDYMKSLDF